jgi:5'-nucleotidase
VDWILITNDDGADAPSLPPFARAMAEVAPVRVVVPHVERSWVGKAITRFEPIRVDVVERDGQEIHTATGFPADCSQLGIHALFDTPPRLVVSGINVGYNHGAAYLQSSGTVGAALEASLSGVDALAFSTGSIRMPWRDWRRWAWTPESVPMWERLGEIAADIARHFFAAAPLEVVASINLPAEAETSTERRLTTVADVGYNQLFRRAEDGTYVHDFGGAFLEFESLEGTDVQAAGEEVIAISSVRATHGAALPEQLRRTLLT